MLGTRVITALLLLVTVTPAFTQVPVRKKTPPPPPVATQPSAPEAPPEDALGRSTPHGTVTGFLSAAGREDFARAAKYLDSQQSPRRKEELARQLKLVIDRGLGVDVYKLDRTKEGSPEDTPRPDREIVGVAKSGSESLEIVLQRVQRDKKQPIWLFSSVTLLSIPDFAEGLQAPWIETHLPQGLVQRKLAGISLYRWLLVPISLVAIFAVACVFVWLLALVFRNLFARNRRKDIGDKAPSLVGPLRLLLFTLLLQLFSRLAPTLVARRLWIHVAVFLTVAGLCWLVMRVLDMVADLARQRLEQAGARSKIAIVHLVRALSKPLIIAIGAAVILSLEGVNTTAIITSLGVGGIAIAFAAQKTIENLFGTVMLVSDQPIRIGDMCKFCDLKDIEKSGLTGKVEAIGLCSTRVRTVDRTVVTIPNGQLASMSLENLTLRDKFLFNHKIGLRRETTAGQLDFVLGEIRRLLKEHPKVELPSARTRLVRFGGSSLDLDLFAYIVAAEYTAFLAVQEDLLLRIMDVIAASGTALATPSQITYLASDLGLPLRNAEATSPTAQYSPPAQEPSGTDPSQMSSEAESNREQPAAAAVLHVGR